MLNLKKRTGVVPIQLGTQVDIDNKKIYFRLYNGTKKTLKGFSLCFNATAMLGVKSASNVVFEVYDGTSVSCNRIGEKPLRPYETWNFVMTCDEYAPIHHENDFAKITYITEGLICHPLEVEATPVRFIDSTVSKEGFTPYKNPPRKSARKPARQSSRRSTRKSITESTTESTEKNMSKQIMEMEIPIFPKVKKVELKGSYANFSRGLALDDSMSKTARGSVTRYQSIFEDWAFINGEAKKKLYITMLDSPREKSDTDPEHKVNEKYRLIINNNSIEVQAYSKNGVLYALISMYQLLFFNSRQVPCGVIDDEPRFAWRGFMLDTVRQFYTTAEIKRYIRLCAMHKINVFHWHITDDEAWRVELEAYPHLAKQWGFRGAKDIMPALGKEELHKYGGIYKESEIRGIHQYARGLGITMMLEFDIPGHSYALKQAMPELQEKADKSDYYSVQDYHNNALNPALDETYDILKTIIDEMSKASKGPYFHFGCDEIPKNAWKDSPACKKLMEKHNLKNTYELQTYFTKKVEEMIRENGKRPAAWEEAGVNGEASQDTILFSWQGEEAGKKAAKKGYSVVMCPAQHYYFDMVQSPLTDDVGISWAGYTTLEKTYKYEPCHGLGEESKHIIGVQANLWSEHLWRKSRIDYMLFPRMVAFAEGAWTDPTQKNYEDFVLRMNAVYIPMLHHLDVGYCYSYELIDAKI